MFKPVKIIILAFLLNYSLYTQPITQSFYNYKTIETKHFKIHFPENYKDFANLFLQLAEKIHYELSNIYFIENKKTHLVLIFCHDISNAYTTVYGMDTIVFYLTQPQIGSFANYKDWYRQLIIHEYVHIITLRPYKGFLNNTFRILFGVPPNLSLPNGLIEGIAVVEESNNKELIGRLYDANTNSLLRNQLLYNKFPTIEEIFGGSYYWPMEDINYLYGARFIQTIIDKEGSKKQFLLIFYSKHLPVFLRLRFKENHLKSYDEYYKDFKQNEYNFYKKWFRDKMEISITPYEQLTFNGGEKKYLKLFNDRLYYFEKSSFRSTGIYILNSNSLFYKSINLNDYYIFHEHILTSEPIYYNGNNIINYNIFYNKKEIIESTNKTTRKWYPLLYKNTLIYIEKNDPYISLIQVPLIKEKLDYYVQEKQ
ncbi:MAG: hypothetical protein KatS3mg129_0667 [Leptospiraceae bacterium]|nr:MAG: hypothetical protein KatS3mg129_0667 [Leptospiraceae bacterium]